MHSKWFVIQSVANIFPLRQPSTLSHPLLPLLVLGNVFLVGVTKWRGTKKEAFLEAGEEGRDQDFAGRADTGGMGTKENIRKTIAEIFAVMKWLVSSTVFMLPSGYFCIQNKHERQNMGIVWVIIFNTLLYKYVVTAWICIIGVRLFFSWMWHRLKRNESRPYLLLDIFIIITKMDKIALKMFIFYSENNMQIR